MKNLLKISILGIIVCCFASCIYYQRYPMAKKRLFKLKNDALTFYLIDPSRPLSGMWYVNSYDFREKDMTLKMTRISEREAITVTNIGSRQDARLSKNDVLIYIKPQEARGFSDSLTTTLKYDQLERVEVYETNYGKSVGMSFVGYVTVGIVLAGLITGGFCQSVYAVNPTDGPLQGELFAGAAWSNAIRTEYLYLPDVKSQNDIYTIRLGGKDGQVQQLDEVKMYAFEHPTGTQLIMDRYGKAQLISDPVNPLQAIDHQKDNAMALLAESDGNYWPLQQEGTVKDATQSLELKFSKPAGAKSARLLLRAKNSLWLDAVFNEYRLNFPGALPGPDSKREETERWLQQQQIPLAVSLMAGNNNWQSVGHFNPNGTILMRNEVLEIDLSQHQGSNICLRLECGFQFWELDYAALDFSTPQAITKSLLTPLSTHPKALEQADGHMHSLHHFNDDVLLSFQTLPSAPEGMQRSLFVCGTGYYTFAPIEKPLKSPKKSINLPDYSLRKWQTYSKIKI